MLAKQRQYQTDQPIAASNIRAEIITVCFSLINHFSQQISKFIGAAIAYRRPYDLVLKDKVTETIKAAVANIYTEHIVSFPSLVRVSEAFHRTKHSK